MKPRVGRGLKRIALWTNRVSAVVLVVCLVLLAVASIIEVKGEKNIYRYYKTPIERRNTAFENTELFSGILKEQIADISRMCVIRNQLESNGFYNGHKKIDISSFANREDILAEETVTATYYLDDLIKWGNYGFAYETIGERTELYDRYLTVEGKELEEYASSNEEYKILVTNLQVTASELFQNYTEYTKYQKKYADGKTNIVFCYAFKEGDVTSYYTNINTSLKGKSADDINALFSKYKKFVSYNPEKMQLSTNTGLNAQDMKNILSQYDYSFQDNSRIWIGIPDSYEYEDVLYNAYSAYKEYEPYVYIWILAGLAALIVFVASFVAMTKMELVVVYEGKGASRIEKQNKIWLEIYLLACAASICAVIFALKEFFEYLPGEGDGRYTLAYIAGGVTFLFHIIFAGLYLGGIQRIKGGNILKNTFVYAVIKKIKKGMMDTYDNGSLITRTWLPYLLFLAGNLVLVLWNLNGIILAFVLDMVIGAYLYLGAKEREKIVQGIEKIKGGDFAHKIPTKHLHGDNLVLAKSVNSIGESIHQAVETSMKDEKMKADLITNVSHDIKTPLTSIINYVDLIKRENIADEKIRSYVDILDMKSQRLKQLTDDLVEASKISSGNIAIQYDRINFVEFVNQVFGEFSEKFEEKNLTLVERLPSVPIYIKVDSSHLFRVIENLYNNITKYALEGTRVYLTMEEYIDLEEDKKRVEFAVKNISAQPLNVSAEELTERFVQGDESRRSEGSGLGLSIAKNLMKSMGGDFELQLDGDLFKAILTFDVLEE